MEQTIKGKFSVKCYICKREITKFDQASMLYLDKKDRDVHKLCEIGYKAGLRENK